MNDEPKMVSDCCGATVQIRGTHPKDWKLTDGTVIPNGIYDRWDTFCMVCGEKCYYTFTIPQKPEAAKDIKPPCRAHYYLQFPDGNPCSKCATRMEDVEDTKAPKEEATYSCPAGLCNGGVGCVHKKTYSCLIGAFHEEGCPHEEGKMFRAKKTAAECPYKGLKECKSVGCPYHDAPPDKLVEPEPRQAEGWRKRFEEQFSYMRPSVIQRARHEVGALNPNDFDDIEKFIASELEAKNREIASAREDERREIFAVHIRDSKKRARVILDKVRAEGYEEGKAYWEPSDHHKDKKHQEWTEGWVREVRFKVLEEVKEAIENTVITPLDIRAIDYCSGFSRAKERAIQAIERVQKE